MKIFNIFSWFQKEPTDERLRRAKIWHCLANKATAESVFWQKAAQKERTQWLVEHCTNTQLKYCQIAQYCLKRSAESLNE